MELVITPEDFRLLSPATQRELLSMLFGGETDIDPLFASDDFDPPATGSKRVLGVTPNQAAELLSNLAEKSQNTLRLFALGDPVPVDSLVGGGCPYKDINDLKRSFVGAVNRRLRTVTGNRSAVLFSSDKDRQIIRVLPMTSQSLRKAMSIPEQEVSEADDTNDYPNATFDEATDEVS